MLKVGSFVQAWWDTGAFGMTPMYGIVRQSGPKSVMVEWRSGIRNRIPQEGGRGVKPVSTQFELDCAMEHWGFRSLYLFS